MYNIQDFSKISETDILNNFKNLIVDAVACAAPIS